MHETRELVEAMPKCEPHLHIEGTLEPELKFQLARRNKFDVPYSSVEEIRAAYDFNDLPSFLTYYYDGMTVLHTEPDFYDRAWAYVTPRAGTDRSRIRRSAGSSTRALRVTINSDDPAYFGGYVNENLVAVADALGLGADELVQLQRNAFEVAWLPRAVEDEYLAELTVIL